MHEGYMWDSTRFHNMSQRPQGIENKYEKKNGDCVETTRAQAC